MNQTRRPDKQVFHQLHSAFKSVNNNSNNIVPDRLEEEGEFHSIMLSSSATKKNNDHKNLNLHGFGANDGNEEIESTVHISSDGLLRGDGKDDLKKSGTIRKVCHFLFPAGGNTARILLLFSVVLLLNFVIMMCVIVSKWGKAKTDLPPSFMLKPSKLDSRLPAVEWKPLPNPDQVLTRIAFGSSSSQNMPQPFWDTLVDVYMPELTLLMGDNVYGDCVSAAVDNNTQIMIDDLEDTDDDVILGNGNSFILHRHCENLFNAYYEWAMHASFQGAAQRLSILPTLDDHDYGYHNCDGVFNPYKKLAKNAFVDFFYEAVPQSIKDQDGVYQAREWGPLGKRLQVIMLDTRYNRFPFHKTGKADPEYEPWDENNIDSLLNNPEIRHYINTQTNKGTIDPSDKTAVLQMLGENQWQWLEEQLKRPADLRLIVSSIQVLNGVTGQEAWRMMPTEQKRLMHLIQKSTEVDDSNGGYYASTIVLLSGDRHLGGFYSSSAEHKYTEETGFAYENVFFEMTSSAWTDTLPCQTADTDANPNVCSGDATYEVDPHRIGSFVHVNNFGTIDIDWERRTFNIALRRADSTPDVTYKSSLFGLGKHSDAGEVIIQYNFTLPDM